MTARARRRWPLTSVTAALGCTALGYVLLAPSAPVDELTLETPDAGEPTEVERTEVVSYFEVKPPPEEVDVPEDEEAGAGGISRHRGEEGKMGKPTSKSKTGLYAMKGPKDAVPSMARDFDPESTARSAGVLGAMEGESGHYLATPHGGAFAVGDDDADVWGGLTGSEVGEAYGVGGLGLVGTGRGGGGTGEGSIGLGGKGAGAGYGSLRGRGFDGNLQARTLTVGTVDDFSDARAWQKAADEMAHASARLGITDEWIGLEAPGQRHVDAPDALDVALVLDTTGSMSDELEYLKVELRDIATEVGERFPGVDQRWGLIVYRDNTDAYVVRAKNLTELESMVEFLGQQHAGGGGDFPEAMDLALEASEQLDWRRDRNTARMVFLVADAPPHQGAAAERFLEAVRGHRNAGTAIYPVSASGVDDMAEMAMRVAARATGGQYIYLTDHSGIGGHHKKPHTEETKIETLHDVMLRMIAQELGGEDRPVTARVDTPPTEPEPTFTERPEESELPAVAAPEPESETLGFWAELQKRLGEHFLFAMLVSMAVLGAMGVDTARGRKPAGRTPVA